MKKKLKKKDKYHFKVLKYSNVVQHDCMGYPLRLCIVETNKPNPEQMWLESCDLEGDVECTWTKRPDENAEEE